MRVKYSCWLQILCFLSYVSMGADSSAAGRMSVSLSGGSVTQWTTAGMDQTSPLTAVSPMLF